MKKLFTLISGILLSASMAWSSTPYCATAPIGYGSQATGGGNATPTLVTSVDELETALKAKDSGVIIITKNLTFSDLLSVQSSDKTLLALPGVRLISNQQNRDHSGILYFKKGSDNLIIRNITFEGPGAYDCDGSDLLCFDGVTNAWVDHCDFQDGCDGNFDNKGNTDNITVTWCRFHYLKEPKAGGSGGTDDHRFSNLLGSDKSDKPADGTYNMTWAYCWWDEGCVERMLRFRNASLHFLNCYWNSSVANYYLGPENADAYIQGCTFGGKLKADGLVREYNNSKNGIRFVDCAFANGTPDNISGRTVLVPSYTYTALTAAEAKSLITNAECGAGATLTVTTDGTISSSCDSETPTPDPDPEPEPEPEPTPDPSQSAFWNFSDDVFSGYTEFTATTTVDGLTIVATADKAISIDNSNRTYGDIQFTRRLKFGGSMSADARYVSFPVSGECTIEVYALSASGSAIRPLQLAAGDPTNVIHTWVEVGSDNMYFSYTYTGEATTLYIGSGNSGINLYGIRYTPASTDPDPEPEPEPEPTPTATITWNFSEAAFADLPAEITELTTIEDLTIAATSGNTVKFNDNNKVSGDTLFFTKRLQLGGTMREDSRYLSFAVSGNCTIEVFAISSSSGSVRQLLLTAGTWDNVIHTWEEVNGTDLQCLTFHYTGSATTFYIGSASGGINLYGVNYKLDPQTPSGCETIVAPELQGRTYNILGQPVDESYRGIVIRDGKKFLQ